MRQIPVNKAGPQWDGKLLEDLTFIKKRLRYPVSKKTLPSLVGILLLLVAVARLLLPVFFTANTNPVVSWIFLSFAVLFVAFAFMQYLSRLRFAVLPTPFLAQENRKMLEQFLRSQQLATFSHPQAPEVFQIISTPIGNPKNDHREVMIFISDDNRILINSHFTNRKFALVQSSGNYKQMATRLRDWVAANNARGIVCYQ